MSYEKIPFTVYPLEENNLNAFKEVFKAALTMENIRLSEQPIDKLQFTYLTNYLFVEPQGLQVKTIIVEYQYNSIPFLKDYVNYYASCYFNYERNCRRVHFFSKRFNDQDFYKMVVNAEYDENWESYVGYIVVKPLPSGFIGPTVLQPYRHEEGRFYTGRKKYPVNLFGRSLEVNTMQYQEQDGIVGSCASAALGFAFQKTSELFGSAMPSASDITLLAGDDPHYSGKSFPNTDMTVLQIGKAITSTGLLAENIEDDDYLNDDRWFNACAYAYLKSGIPLLLGIDIDEVRLNHLIALNGYRFGKNKLTKNCKDFLGFKLVSDDIIKFYAHDDQLGPFTRVEIDQNPKRLKKFISAYQKKNKPNEYLQANPVCLIIPLSKSIKVSFHNVALQVLPFETLLSSLLVDEDTNEPIVDIAWDIYLAKSNDYKNEVRNNLIVNKNVGAQGQNVLFHSLPQYIWVIRAYEKNGDNLDVLFDMLYDAVDVNFNRNPYYVQIFDVAFYHLLVESRVLYKFPEFRDYYKDEKFVYTDLYEFLSEDNSVLDFLEQKEDEIKANLKVSTLTKDAYLKAIDQDYKGELNERIEYQRDAISKQLPNENPDQ